MEDPLTGIKDSFMSCRADDDTQCLEWGQYFAPSFHKFSTYFTLASVMCNFRSL